ncbi:MAG: ComEC/Rec2 family competence protein [Clostridia bacterium]|nr:ComEC/Rec2 family competence protein [Clostridia bacterium]
MLNGKRIAFIFGAYAGIFSLYTLIPQTRNYIWLFALAVTALFSLQLFFSEKPLTFSARKIVLALLMAAATTIASFSTIHFTEKTEISAQRLIDENPHTFTAYITDIYYEEAYGASYEIVLTESDGKKTDIGAVLTLPSAEGFSVLDTVTFEGICSAIGEEFALSRKADGIWLEISAETAQKIGKTEKKSTVFFSDIRALIHQNFQKYLGTEEADFAAALLIGERENLAGTTRLAFTRLGISHILSVSGLHLSVIIGGMDMLFRLLTVSKKKKDIFLILFTVCFACICGLSASIMRAAIMLSVYYIADILGEKSDSVTSLFFALFAILILQPRAVYDVGLWLSFLSTFGILTVMPILHFSFPKKFPRILQKICCFFLSSLCMTLAATFFTMPVTYLTFGGLSLVSPLANLIFVPLTQIILYLLILLTVFGWIPLLASLLGTLSEGLIALTVSLAETFSDIKDIYISIRYPFAVYIITALALGILTVLFIKKLRPSLIFAVFLACTIAFGTAYGIYQHMNTDTAYLYLQTDEKSDIIGIVSNGDVMLIDITTGGYTVPKEAATHLADFYECEIDTYVLTHYHRYHANTLRKLSENIKIHKILFPVPLTENDEKYYREILSALPSDIETKIYETGNLSVGTVNITLPEQTFLRRSSHPIISFSAKVGTNGKTFAYLGSSALETHIPTETVILCGSHGPVNKHIFSAELLTSAELVVFSEKETAFLTETDRIGGTIVYAEDYGEYFRILFEDGN